MEIDKGQYRDLFDWTAGMRINKRPRTPYCSAVWVGIMVRSRAGTGPPSPRVRVADPPIPTVYVGTDDINLPLVNVRCALVWL